MKYDDASWHYEASDFPKELPSPAGAIHSGMFFAWIVLNDLCSDEHASDFASEKAMLSARDTTPAQYLMTTLDGKLLDEDMNATGNAFAMAYFNLDGGAYISDYLKVFEAKGLDAYRIADSWENYDMVAKVISRRYDEWRESSS